MRAADGTGQPTILVRRSYTTRWQGQIATGTGTINDQRHRGGAGHQQQLLAVQVNRRPAAPLKATVKWRQWGFTAPGAMGRELPKTLASMVNSWPVRRLGPGRGITLTARAPVPATSSASAVLSIRSGVGAVDPRHGGPAARSTAPQTRTQRGRRSSDYGLSLAECDVQSVNRRHHDQRHASARAGEQPGQAPQRWHYPRPARLISIPDGARTQR